MPPSTPAFDIDTYLATKAAADSKLQSLAETSKAKVAELSTKQTADQNIVSAAQLRHANEGSWAARLGLEPGSFLGNRVNDVASIASGTARVAGQLASLPANLSAGMATMGLQPEDTDAWNRYQAGQQTPEDMQRLSRPTDTGPGTVLDRFMLAQDAGAAGRSISNAADVSSIVDPTNRQALNASLENGFDQHWAAIKSGEPAKIVSGVAGLLYNAGDAIVKNPSGVREYILENMPQLAVGAAPKVGQGLMAASNVGYALDFYQQGIEAYAKSHDGQLPADDVREKMALQAASLAIAEEAGDVAGLKFARSTGGGALAKAGNVIKAGAEGAVTEAPTEAFQQYMEGEITGKPASAKEIYTAGVIGGASGAGLSGGGRAIGEATNTTPEAVEAKKAAVTESQAQDKAIETGDASAFSSPSSPLYAPEKAIAALYGHVSRPGATEEEKTAALDQARQVLSELNDKAQALEDKANNSKLKSEERGAAAAESKKVNQQFKDTFEVFKQLQATLAKDVDVNDAVDKADRGDQKAVDTLVKLAMESPDSLNTEIIKKLADNEAVPEQTRQYLRAFSEARQAENILEEMGSVTKTILHGDDKGNLGITQYRDRMQAALATGNKEQADKTLGMLKAFAADHEAKARVASQAMRKGMGTQIIRGANNGSWQINTGEPLSKLELRKNGGLSVDSQRLVNVMQGESATLNKSLNELQRAYEIKFTPTKAAQDVKVQPQREGKDGTREAAQPPVQTAEAVRSDAPAEGSGVPDARSAGTVEAGGLKDSKAEPAASSSTVSEAAQAEESGRASAATATLDVMRERTPDKSFNEKNLLADHFTQSASNESDKTQRPLAVVKDFVSQRTRKISEFLGFTPSDKQKELISSFYTALKHWGPVIQANLVRTPDRKFWFKDMMQFLIVDNGGKLDLEENVKTAMGYAAFSWVIENAMRPINNTPAEINAILRRDETHPVSNEEVVALGKIGLRDKVVANRLGARAVQALGLKVNKDAPADLMPRLESAIGTHILKLLMDEGIVVRAEISGDVMAMLTTSEDTKEQAEFNFVRMARTKDGALNKAALSIAEDARGTGNVLDKLFSVESAVKAPNFEPVPFTQKVTKTLQKVPSLLAKILKTKNEEPNHLRSEMFGLFEALGKEVAYQVAGTQSKDGKHLFNQKSIDAANDALKREVDRLFDFVADMGDRTKPFYFEHDVWSQQRVGIATNLINPQTSKVHRHMVSQQGWETEVDPANPEQLNNFLLRVGEGLGVKTDKKSNATNLPIIEQKIQEPEIRAAVDALIDHLNGKSLTDAQKQAIVAGVKAGGQKMHSLDSLMALAKMEDAAGDAFKVTLVGEVDGVTNGPMLSHLFFGAAASGSELLKMLNRGGFFQLGSKHTQYNQWREDDGNFDLYETTSLHMVQAAKELAATGVKNRDGKVVMSPQRVKAVLAAIEGFTGTLENNGVVEKAGRDIIKTPLTAMVFGSAISKAIDSMANDFIEKIYAGIEKASTKPQNVQQVFDDLNTLLTLGGGERMDASMGIEQLMLHEFTKDEIGAIKRAFGMTLGNSVRTTMQKDFGTFLAQRNQFNETAKLTFELYHATYNGLRAALIRVLAAKKEIEVSPKTGQPLHDLTPAQEKQLRDRLKDLEPLLHTYMSQQSGELNAGLRIAKRDKLISQDNTYKTEVKFGTPVPGKGVWSPKEKAYVAQKGMVARAYETGEKEPGAAMAPTSVHSSDSAISHLAAYGHHVLNIHDAHGTGVGTAAQTAQNLNKATWDVLLNYSPATEMLNALSRTVNELASLLQQKDVPAEVHEELTKALAKMASKMEDVAPDGVIGIVMEAALRTAAHADRVKFEVLSQLQSIDQYAFEGGAHAVSQAERDAAAAKLKAVASEVSPADRKAIETISSLLGTVEAKAATKEASNDQNTETQDQPDPSFKSADLGTFSAVRMAQLLEAVSLDYKSLSAAVMDNARKVLNTMVSAGVGFAEAIKVLDDTEGAALLQLLAERAASQPDFGYGERGQPGMVSDPQLVQFFENTPRPTAKQVLGLLRSRIAAGPKNRITQFNLQLLERLATQVRNELDITYVTPQTDPALLVDGIMDKSRGWYAAKNGLDGIYVMSPDYRYSGLTTETLLHEMTHAVLAQIIAREQLLAQGNPNYKSEALDLIDELERLREAAQKFIKDNKLTNPEFGFATSNVQEIVAWGMTNQTFQREVLVKMKFESKNKGNPLVSGIKAFIQNLVGILFHGSGRTQDQQLENGLGVLIMNVSGLFHEAAGRQDPKPEADVSLAQNAQTNAIQSYTTLDIHEALENPATPLKPAFEAHLRNLLTGIVEKLHGPFGSFKAAMAQNQAATPLDAWLKALATGQAPFASQVMASPLMFSQQEAHVIEQVEATVRAAIDGSEAHSKIAYQQLSELFTEARKTVKPEAFHPGSWASATADEKRRAQEQWDFIFKVPETAGKNDYLARFAALGLGHQAFNGMLQFKTQRDVKTLADGKTFADKLQILFENMLAFFNDKIAHTFVGQRADAKLQTLVEQLVDVENKRRFMLTRKATQLSVFQPIEDAVKHTVEGAMGKVNQLLSSQGVRNHANVFMRAAGGAARVVANNQVDVFMDGIKQLRDRTNKGKLGLAASFINEFTGPLDRFKFLLLSAKNNERLRKQMITNAGNAVMAAFEKNGADITKEERAAITKVFMRTGLHNLLDQQFDMAKIREIISDKSKLDAEIKNFERQLLAYKPFHLYFINQSNALAYYKAQGRVKEQWLMMNSHNIASMYGTPYEGRLGAEQTAAAAKVMDSLIALYALGYSNSVDLHNASSVLAREAARTDGGNGVEFVLKLHKRMELESRERLFEGRPTMMMHGYTPEIYNPYTGITVANAADGRDLELQGYSKGGAVRVDPHDEDQEQRSIYVLKHGGLQERLTGAMSYRSRDAKGTKQHNGWMNVNTSDGLDNAIRQTKLTTAKHAALSALFTGSTRADLSQKDGNYLAPVLNPDGEIVNWRYLMSEDVKDTLLERDNRFDKVMGMLAGSIFDKQSAIEQNRDVVQALKDVADLEYKKYPTRFVSVGPKSNDAELREIWALLPKSTRDEVRRVWGHDAMLVRKDSLDLMFGYRKLSLADILRKDPAARAGFEKLFSFLVENTLTVYARARLGMNQPDAERYAARAAVVVQRAERMWQEMVKETKDLIVVKTGVVLFGNIWSNISLLVLKGVPIKDIVHHHMVALKGATQYQQDSEELAQLKMRLESGYTQGQEDEMRQQITRLQDSLARNPVKELIDAGLMPTIVEDIEQEDNLYSYKNAFTKKVESVTSKLNPSVLNLAKGVYMTHDTALYKGLSRITQLSDFVARYTLYQHQTTRAKDPLVKSDAIIEANDNFVNYDVPMHRLLQYTDDMGLTMFTKYFLRIQRPLLKLKHENPARAITAIALSHFFDLGSIVTDSSMFSRIGRWPFTSGAFKFFGAVDDLATVNVAMKLIK